MIKGLAITPPVVGRISIGKTVERNGKRLPQKDDEFTITSQVQTPDGWHLHPLDAQLRKEPGQKLRSIPVRVLFDQPELNFRAQYSLFNRETGRPVCVGNGETARRVEGYTVQSHPCPEPSHCQLGQGGLCKPYGRLNVIIDTPAKENAAIDELGSFILRTTGYNSIRTLTARLAYYAAVSGNKLSAMPLELKLRGKSTMQSYRAPIYYVDLVTREGMSLEQAVQEAQKRYQQRWDAGVNQQALEAAAREGLANGEFEDSDDEAMQVAEEFFSPHEAESQKSPQATPSTGNSLKQKLAHKAKQADGFALSAESETVSVEPHAMPE